MSLLLCLDLSSSDLVNGLVLLMNSNISSPVNLVSSSHSVVFHKLKSKVNSAYADILPVSQIICLSRVKHVCLMFTTHVDTDVIWEFMKSVCRGTQRNTPYWSLLVSSKVSSVRRPIDQDGCHSVSLWELLTLAIPDPVQSSLAYSTYLLMSFSNFTCPSFCSVLPILS